MNGLPFSFLVTTSAEPFLVTFGRTISYLLYDAIHEKNQVSQERNPPKVTVLYELENVMYKDFRTTTSQM